MQITVFAHVKSFKSFHFQQNFSVKTNRILSNSNANYSIVFEIVSVVHYLKSIRYNCITNIKRPVYDAVSTCFFHELCNSFNDDRFLALFSHEHASQHVQSPLFNDKDLKLFRCKTISISRMINNE